MSILGLAAAPSITLAALCGDNVEGQDLPCACGDTVASSVILTDDPIIATTCDGDGLLIHAPHAASGIVIDLNGQTLRGTGTGAGIRVVRGGPGGANIVSKNTTASITGFRDGVVAQPIGSVRKIENLSITHCRRDGVRLAGTGTAIHNVEVFNCRRDGFGLRGDGWDLSDLRSVANGRNGFYFHGSNGLLGAGGAGLRAENNGGHGFTLLGGGHALRDCHASFNRGDGLHLNGIRLGVFGCQSVGNVGHGIAGAAPQSFLNRNQVSDNTKGDFDLHSHDTIIDGIPVTSLRASESPAGVNP